MSALSFGCMNYMDYSNDLKRVHCYNGVYNNGYFVSCAIAAVGVPMYHFLFHPLFYKHIPSMLRRIGVGILLIAISFFSNMIVELVAHLENEEIMCMFSMNDTKVHINYLWTPLPILFRSVGYVLVMYCSVEFVIAQTLQQINGLMMCITFEAFGLLLICGYVIGELFLQFPFQAFPSCAFYYYMTYFIIALLNFLFFLTISKWYKLRRRDDIVPYHMFAENYFEKNQILEQEYLQAIRDALDKTSSRTDSQID